MQNKIEKDILEIEDKRKKLTDMLLDDLITKETYDENYNDLVIDLHKSIDKRTKLENNIGEQRNISVWYLKLLLRRSLLVVLMKEEYKMSMKDIEKMKKFIEEKKSKVSYYQAEKKIGSGKVEKMNKNIGIDSERTKKISQ